MIPIIPCWSCQLCRRLDGVQDPDTCPYEDRWCPAYKAWAAQAWADAVALFRPLMASRPAKAIAKSPVKQMPRTRNRSNRTELERRNRLIWRRYKAGLPDADIERALGLDRGTVYHWRKRRNLPSNRSTHGATKAYWSIFLAKTDELVAQGTTDEVIRQLRMSDSAFRTMVSNVRYGRAKKYIVLKNGRNIR